MAKTYRGITVTFGADTSKLGSALKNIDTQLKDTQTNLRTVNKLLDLDPSNTELLQQKQDLLSKSIKLTADRLDELKSVEKEIKDKYSKGLIDQSQFISYQKELISTNKKLEDFRAEMDKMAQSASSSADDLDKAEAKISEISQSSSEATQGFTILKGAMANLASDGIREISSAFKEAMASSEQANNLFQAQTGASAEEMEKYSDIIQRLYSNNYGESMTDVAEVMTSVKENINNISADGLEDVTRNAIILRDTFDIDTSEGIRAINGLMVNMGLTAEQAFDYIAKGAQNGLNKTDELADNIAEYSQIWGQAGFTASEMFTILQNGLENGAYNLDKVNDFVKEFTISLADGRIEDSIDSFSAGTAKLFESWQNGGATAADVFKSVINDLSDMTNKQEALTIASDTWSALGEDNAMDVITSLNNVNDSYNDVKGTIEDINAVRYDDLLNQLEEVKRTIEVSVIQPIAAKTIPLIKKLAEHGEIIVGILAAIGTAKLTNTLGSQISSLISYFKSLKAATESAEVAQAGLNATQAANPMLAIASVLGIIIGSLSAYATAAEVSAASTEEYNEATQRAVSSTNDLADSVSKAREARQKNTESVTNEYAAYSSMAAELLKLNETEALTADQKEQMLVLVGQLNKAIPDLNLTIDKETGKLSDQAETLEKLIEKKKEYAIVNAASDQYAQAAINLTELQNQEAKALENVDNAKKAYHDLRDEYASLTDDLAKTQKEFDNLHSNSMAVLSDAQKAKSDELYNKLLKLRESIKSIEDSGKLDSTNDAYAEANQALMSIQSEIKATQDEMDGYDKTLAEHSDVLDEQTDKTAKAAETEEDQAAAIKESTSALEKAKSAVSSYKSELTNLISVLSNVNNGQEYSTSQILDLLEKYPELTGAISETENGYTLERKAVEKLIEVRAKNLQLAAQEQITAARSSILTATNNMLEQAPAQLAKAQAEYIQALQYAQGVDKIVSDILDNGVKMGSTSSSITSASSAGSSGTTDSTDYFKQAAEAEVSEAEHLYNMGEISAEEYYDRLADINRRYYEGKSEYLSEYNKLAETVYSGLKKAQEEDLSNAKSLEDRIKAVTEAEAKLRNADKQQVEVYSSAAGFHGEKNTADISSAESSLKTAKYNLAELLLKLGKYNGSSLSDSIGDFKASSIKSLLPDLSSVRIPTADDDVNTNNNRKSSYNFDINYHAGAINLYGRIDTAMLNELKRYVNDVFPQLFTKQLRECIEQADLERMVGDD